MATKRAAFMLDEKDVENVKKLAEKFDVPQAVVYRAAVKLVLKMKVTEQKKLFKKK